MEGSAETLNRGQFDFFEITTEDNKFTHFGHGNQRWFQLVAPNVLVSTQQYPALLSNLWYPLFAKSTRCPVVQLTLNT